MNGDIGHWNFGLLFAAVTMILGMIGVVSPQRGSDQSLSKGIFLQGVLLTCVVGAAYRKHGSDLKLEAFVIVSLLIIQHIMLPCSAEDEVKPDEDQSA